MAQTIDLSAYKSLYLQTAREQIGIIRNGLLMVRLNPEDVASLEKIHISAHSLKGQSLAMGYEKTAMYCRTIEYIFRDAQEKKLALSPEVIAAVKEALTQVESSLTSIEASNKEADLTEADKKLRQLTNIKIPAVH